VNSSISFTVIENVLVKLQNGINLIVVGKGQMDIAVRKDDSENVVNFTKANLT
jgi:hypothetical protein